MRREMFLALFLGVAASSQQGTAVAQIKAAHIPSPFATPVVPSQSDAGDSNAKVSPTAAMINFKIRTGINSGTDDQGRLSVTGVREDGPAARAGVKEGDVILQVDDQPIDDQGTLESYVKKHAHAGAFMVTLDRGGKPFTLALGRTAAFLGMLLFPDTVDRPVVQQVFKQSPADLAGLRNGDVITGVNGRMTDNIMQVTEVALPLLRRMPEGAALPLQYVRDGATVKTTLIRPAVVDMPLLPAPIDPNLISRPRMPLRAPTARKTNAAPQAQEPRQVKAQVNVRRPPNGRQPNRQQPNAGGSNAAFLGGLQMMTPAPQGNAGAANGGQANVNGTAK